MCIEPLSLVFLVSSDFNVTCNYISLNRVCIDKDVRNSVFMQ